MLIMIMIRSAARQNYCSNYNGLQKRREVKKSTSQMFKVGYYEFVNVIGSLAYDWVKYKWSMKNCNSPSIQRHISEMVRAVVTVTVNH